MLVVKLDAQDAGLVSVYNMTGQLIQSEIIEGEFRTKLSSGVYVVKVSHDGEVAAKKLVIAQ